VSELTWEEKNPINYLYYTSDALEQLKEILRNEDLKKKIKKKKMEVRDE
jgi:uncharacterized protein YajQ (UPF0234 family)